MKKSKFILLFFIVILISVIIMNITTHTGNSREPSHSGGDRKGLPSPEEIAKLPPDGGPEFNRLIFEKSPYLLQHARNPVDWYPWGEEAFERAKKEDKPIFLSIGYSTCHWCHVMEHESFEDPEVARLLNENFVCIKVDREERPDIDNIYMTVCQALTGSGGWPLTIIMTPDKKPFFAGTYFPKESRYGRIGLLDLIPRIADLWKNRRQEVLESADKITDALQNITKSEGGNELDKTILDKAYEQLAKQYDATNGGFGSAPKFPSPHNLTFLLRYWHRTQNPQALEMVKHTLHAMRRGGIFDHVGFGFHRYSTDAHWIVPHFEKMLYDQAMLSMAYVEAYQATQEKDFAQTAREIFTYVLRDMTSPEGGFYSAEDADSEGEEGKFYLWTIEEINKVLDREDAEMVIKLFNLKKEGNFHEEATRSLTGRNILYLKKSFSELAREFNTSEKTLRERWEKARQKLFEVREKRVHPEKDDKILTDWNGLMIAALAKGGTALQEEKYVKAAERAANFIWENVRDSRGYLLKRYRQGEASLPAHIDDYAFMIWGFLELYEATFKVEYLQRALKLNEIMISEFWDQTSGGFYFSSKNLKELIARPKEIYDGAIPSGNSVAAFDLLRLGRITANPEFEKFAMMIGKAFSKQIERAPAAYTQYLSALNFAIGPSFEVVIAGKQRSNDAKTMLEAIYKHFIPNKILIFRPIDEKEPPIIKIAEFARYQTGLNGKATAYVCQNYACQAPTNSVKEMLHLLNISI